MPVRYDGEKYQTLDGHQLLFGEAAEWSDYARAHQIDNHLPNALIQSNALRTRAMFEKAYAILGCHALITSFYRSEPLNSAVGGKVTPPSAHMSGRAVDSEPEGQDIHACFDILKAHVYDLDYDQLIIEHDKKGNTWLHMSVAQEGVAPRHMAFSLEKDQPTTRSTHG